MLHDVFAVGFVLGNCLLHDDARALREVACEKGYSDVLWALKHVGIKLTEREKAVRRSKPAPLGKRCGHCAKVCTRPAHCSACKSIRYCGAACQKLDWKKHKVVCARMKR